VKEQEVAWPSPPDSPYMPLTFLGHLSNSQSSLQRRRISLSLVLHYHSASAPVSCFPLSSRCAALLAGCCRMLQASADWGRWPWPAQAAARLGGRRAATSPVGAGERVGTGELRLLVPLSLSCSRVWNLQRGRSLPLSRSLVWNLRRVVCYGVMCAAPWRLSDA